MLATPILANSRDKVMLLTKALSYFNLSSLSVRTIYNPNDYSATHLFLCNLKLWNVTRPNSE